MAKKQVAGARPAGPNLKVFYAVLGVVAVAGIAWIGYSVATRGGGAAIDPIELTGVENAQALLQQAQGIVAGKADAKAQVLVFSDFTCPACRMFAQMVEPQIRNEYIASDQVRFTYYDFILGGAGQHRWGFLAARAARCGGDQNKYWEYHDQLFGRQSEWSFATKPPVNAFVEIARLAALDVGVFRDCLNSDKFAREVTANTMLGRQLGVGSTPTVFIGSLQVEHWDDWESVRAAIMRELGTTATAPDSAAGR